MLLLTAAKLPDPPSSGLITRYVLENPYPLGSGLVLLAVIAVWLGVREGQRHTLMIAGVAALLGVAVFVIERAVTTAGEHGKHVTVELVDRVVANDIAGAMAMFSDDATVAMGSPNNPGFSVDYLRGGLDRAASYRIQSNRIRMLDGFNESDDVAIVHLGCFTEVGTGYTPSTWILRIEKQADGQWKVTKLTCVSISNQTPRMSWLGG